MLKRTFFQYPPRFDLKMKIIIYRKPSPRLHSLAAWASALAVGVMCAACGETRDPSSRTSPEPEVQHPDPPRTSDGDPLQGARTENWGIGDRWYDYTFDTHSVAPADISWVILRDEDAYHFRVLRYYGDDGAAGKPAMVVRRWTGDGFGEEQTIKVETSIRSAPACLRFETGDVVSCDDASTFDLVWRTDRRPIPEEGFAIGNPALYATSDGDTHVVQYPSKKAPEALPDLTRTVPREVCEPFNADPDIEVPTRDPRCETMPWRIGSIFNADAALSVSFDDLQTHDVFQMTGTMHVAQWRAEIDELRENLTIWARCTSTDFTAACTPPLDTTPERLSIPLHELAAWTFVDLCGAKGTSAPYAPRIYEQRDVLRAGLWASNEAFELAIQRTDQDIRLRIAPSQPFERAAHDGFSDAHVPRSLWSIPGPLSCAF